MEGTQRQLSTRLADGLGRDDTDGLADIDQRVGGQRPAVALRAHAALGFAGEHGTRLDFLHAVSDHVAQHIHGHRFVTLVEHFAGLRIEHILSEQTRVRTTVGGLDEHEIAVLITLGDLHDKAVLGAAILFTHDDFLRDVDQTTGQVTGFCGTQCGIGQTLTRAVLRDEVLEHGQAFAVVGLDRTRDDLALRVSHEASHTCDLADLHPVASCTGLDHDVHVVVIMEVVAHGFGDLVGAFGPQVDELLAALLVCQQTEVELGVDLGGLAFVVLDDRLAIRRLDDVGECHGHAGPRCAGEAEILERVKGCGDLLRGVARRDVIDNLSETALGDLLVDERVVHRQGAVEQDTSVGGGEQVGAVGEALLLDDIRAARLRVGDLELARLPTGRQHEVLRHANQHLGLHVDIVLVQSHDDFVQRAEHAALPLGSLDHCGQVVQTEDHILARHGDGVTVCRLQDVVGRHHKRTGFSLRLGAERKVDCHLVAIEVRVECGACERRQVDGLAFDQDRLEGLNAQTVQRRCTVEEHRMLGDDFLEHTPHSRVAAIDQMLRALHVLRIVEVHKTLDDERLEQLKRHRLRQTALVHAQARADDDHGTARIIHALTEQVLTEAALLALEHVSQGLERAVRSAGDRTAATAVVEQGVDGFLKHALLVVEHDFRGAELDEALEAVVTVDYTTVQVVEI